MAVIGRRPTRTGATAFGAASGIWAAQALTIALVFRPFWDASGSSGKPEGVLEGFGPALIGLLVAPAAAGVVGLVLALALRLRPAVLHALAPVAALGSLGLCGFGSLSGIPVAALLIGAAWNLGAVAWTGRRARPDADAP